MVNSIRITCVYVRLQVSFELELVSSQQDLIKKTNKQERSERGKGWEWIKVGDWKKI